MKDKFIQFLKDHEWYEEFIVNAGNCSLENLTLDQVLDSENEEGDEFRDYIVMSFIWSKTSQGQEYWKNASLTWLEELAKTN